MHPAAIKRTSLFILILQILVPPAISQVPDDLLIVPGQRIGRVKLENSIDEIVQFFGAPSSVVGNPSAIELGGSDALPAVLYYWRNVPLVTLIVATRDRVKVEYIWLSPEPVSRSYKTEQGITVGATRGDLERVYGQPTARTVIPVGFPQAPALERWIYDRSGLFLVMDRDFVGEIGVFRPGEARNNWKF